MPPRAYCRRNCCRTWLLGAFAAAMFGAVMSSYNATLNSSAALYVCDIHQPYFNSNGPHPAAEHVAADRVCLLSMALVPAYMGADSIIQLIQQLIGLFTMPILSAFIIGLLFRNVEARAVIATIVFGSCFYALLAFAWPAMQQVIRRSGAVALPAFDGLTVWTCVAFALALNRFGFGRRAEFELRTSAARRQALAVLRS